MGRAHDSTSVDVSDEPLIGSSISDDSDREISGDPDRETVADLTPVEGVTEGRQSQAGLPAAFELIAEACAAVKIAEDRVHSAEEALEDATHYFEGQIEALNEKLSVADRRAEMAERHAAKAEERLRIFCQTILTTMHNTR